MTAILFRFLLWTSLDKVALDLDSGDLVPWCSLCITSCSPNDSTYYPIMCLLYIGGNLFLTDIQRRGSWNG